MNEALTFSKFRKPAAIAAASVLALAVSLPGAGLAPSAFAADAAAQPNNSNVTITGLNAGDTVTAYQIANIKVQDDNTLAYNFDSDLAGQTATINQTEYKLDSAGDLSKVTGELSFTDTSTAAQQLAAAYADKKSDLNSENMSATDEDKDGEATLNLAPGYYLVQVTNTSGTAKVYQNMLVSVTPQAQDGVYVAADAQRIAVKSSDVVVDKYVTGTDDHDADATSAYKVGDVIPFTIATAVPNYPSNSKNATFTIGDAPTNMKVLNTTTNPVTVTVGAGSVQAGDGTYKLNVSEGGVLSIDFAKDYVLKHQGENVTVTYSAQLTGVDLKSGEASNKATVTFNPNPYESVTSTPEDIVTDKTYGYVFQKTLGNDDTKANATDKQAEFTLYDVAGANEVKIGVGDNATSVFKTDASGYVTIKGLAAGTYILKETKVPAGFQKVNDIKFTVGDDYITKAENTTGKSVSITTNGDNPATTDVAETNFTVAVDYVNDPAQGALPSTGEAGTYMLIIAGIALAAGGTALVMRARKQED